MVWACELSVSRSMIILVALVEFILITESILKMNIWDYYTKFLQHYCCKIVSLSSCFFDQLLVKIFFHFKGFLCWKSIQIFCYSECYGHQCLCMRTVEIRQCENNINVRGGSELLTRVHRKCCLALSPDARGFCEQHHDRYTPKLSDRKIIKKMRSSNNN